MICAKNLILACTISIPAFAAPISTYYLTAGDQGQNARIQGAVATLTPQAHPANLGEYAIAVDSTVRTLGNGNDGVNLGAQYDLNFSYLSIDYAYPNAALAFYDGTTDGVNNYSIDYDTGNVYRMNLDWSSPVLLFSTNAPFNVLGITYDPTNNSLWISGFGNNTVTNYTLAGGFLSSFSTAQFPLTSLALDHADGTLWMGSQGTQGTFYQYSKAGALLDTVVYANLANQNTLGGEFAFNAVPEPSSMLLLAGGLALFALKRRVK